MRAGPLSDKQVIDLLNGYFIPVFSSNEDSGPQGHGADRAEHLRIYREAAQSPCGTGAVFVFILNPQGRVIDGMDAAHASQGNALAQMLRGVIQKLNIALGPTVVQPVPQSQPPAHDSDSLVLHIASRSFLKAAPWGTVPAENWVILSAPEWQGLLPSGQVAVGSSWTIPDSVAVKFLRKFYPPMEELNSNDDRSRIQTASLRATIISVTHNTVQARIDGLLKMSRTFFARREDNNAVDATLLGLLEFDPSSRRISDFELVTEKATYGPTRQFDFAAALQLSLPLSRNKAMRRINAWLERFPPAPPKYPAMK